MAPLGCGAYQPVPQVRGPTGEETEAIDGSGFVLCVPEAMLSAALVGTSLKRRASSWGKYRKARGLAPAQASGAEEMGLEGTGVGWQPGEGPYAIGPSPPGAIPWI